LRGADDDLAANAAQRRQQVWEKALPVFCASYKLVQKRQEIAPGRRFGLDV
jgi:hypothetical protein